MDVVSLCPLRVAAVVWQPRPGAFALTVACKATYRLEPVSSPLADEQDEVHEVDQHWDDDEARSVSTAGDLAPFKRRTDVMLVGSAFAPGGAPARSLVARLQIGDVDKAIEVWSDRALTRDGRLVEGPRFAKMSLRWERAAGGPGTANPVGMRFDAPPSADGRVAVPNLQPPWKPIARLGDTFEPIGFGPVAPSWPGRAWLLHQHAPSWSHQRWFERPLPHDVDPRYFNAAPPDQQTDALPPDARIVLENLHPAHPRLITNLVPVRPRAVIERPGRPPEPLELACDTLFIDADRGICTLTFRGRAPLAHAGEAGRVAITLEGAERAERGAPITIAPPPEAARPPGPAKLPRQRLATLVDGVQPTAVKASALPFVPTRVGAEPDAARLQPLAGLPFRETQKTEAHLFDGDERTGVFPDLAPRPGAVPFGARAPASDEPTGLIDLEALRRDRAPLPFAKGPATSPPVPAIAAAAPSLGTIPPPPLAPGADVAPPFWRRITSTSDEHGDLLDAEILDADPVDDEPPEADTIRPPAPAVPGVAPLPAPAAMSFPAPRVPRFGDFPATIEPVARPEPEPAPPREEETEPLDVDIYATVKIAFWTDGEGSRAAIEETVRDLGLDEDAFRAGEERLLEALAGEAREGHATLARELRAAMKRALHAAAERAGEAPGGTAGS
jgi:hypothetical protein